jgi:hypothetical protein
MVDILWAALLAIGGGGARRVRGGRTRYGTWETAAGGAGP